jgi:hypothetical protein
MDKANYQIFQQNWNLIFIWLYFYHSLILTSNGGKYKS